MIRKPSLPLAIAASAGLAVSLLVPARCQTTIANQTAPGATSQVTIDYPRDGSIFPPEITPPTFIWHDDTSLARSWHIDIVFSDGSPSLHLSSRGDRPSIGEIDIRCISSTNELPKLTAEQSTAHTWTPSALTWTTIKRHSIAPATVTISGYRRGETQHALSSGQVELRTSRDKVGAPIFYRDVPLMPAETSKGVVQPLAPSAVQLIQWRLRSIDQPQSRVVLSGMHTCANCHSFSRDGRTMGMDMDGPRNDKGLYALVPVKPQMTIRAEDMVNWNPTQEHQFASNRVAFGSQVSPDGAYVLTMLTSADSAPENNYYVSNFKDYRFLQVFYPTRGVLAWYDRGSGQRHTLPGADDPRFVQTDGVWSPDGKYIVFARAEARDPYPATGRIATYANSPSELQIQYDLFRIPFNDGRGGTPEPIVGASANGMSNSFPKISPDGRWIVFVKARNGQLMRPDSELYIIPAEGGEARRLNANRPPMNSWHSWSPNGSWLVFSSKSRGPYTRMYLTHIDPDGNDSPAIFIDNAAASNRAVNIPEFVNIPPDGMMNIATPAVDMYKRYDHAMDLDEKGEDKAAILEWKSLAASNPDDARIHNNLAAELARTAQYEEAVLHYEKALALNLQYNSVHGPLALALMKLGRTDEALQQYEIALHTYPGSADLHNWYGSALARRGRLDEATEQFTTAITLNPRSAEAQNNLGIALAREGRIEDAVDRFTKAIVLNPRFAEPHNNLGIAFLSDPGIADSAKAEKEFGEAIEINPHFADAQNNLGTLYRQQGNNNLAERLFHQAIESDPRYMKAYVSLSETLSIESRFAEAEAVIERALQIIPASSELQRILEHIKRQEKQ